MMGGTLLLCGACTWLSELLSSVTCFSKLFLICCLTASGMFCLFSSMIGLTRVFKLSACFLTILPSNDTSMVAHVRHRF